MKRWTYTHNPAAGTTCVITVPAAGNSRHVVDKLLVSQRNQTAAAYTATLTVRDASVGGTVLAQVEYVTATNSVDRGTLEATILGIKRVSTDTANIGAVVAHFAPPAASVTQKITAAGWTEAEPY